MNAFTAINSADAIYTFMPGIDEAEHKLRAKLQTMRNCAAAMIAKTESDTARALAWLCSDYATAHVYAGGTHAELTEIARLCNQLLITAMHAEAVDEGMQ